MPDRTVQFQLGGTLRILVDDAPDARSGAKVTIRYGGFEITAWGDAMAYTLPSGNAVAVKISYVDSAGNPANVDGDVEWSSSNESIVKVQAEGDTMSATVSASGPVGQAQIVARADADLGAGVRPLITTMDVEVVAGEAVAGTIEPVGASAPMTPQPVRK